MRKILLDNAYESWSSAIEYHDYIKQGYATIKYKKQFVSSLHNAVELFLKQILLDKNDHDVAEIKKVKNADMANLRAEYYASHNLNQFFEDLEKNGSDNLNYFSSIPFYRLIGKANKIIGKNSYEKSLKLLQALRNNGTHFYINGKNFLNDKEFLQLHNFMLDFFDYLCEINLIPVYRIDSKTNEKIFDLEYRKLNFNEKKMDNFSYVDVVKSNDLSLKIKKVITSDEWSTYCYSCSTIYDFVVYITVTDKQLDGNFNDIYTLLIMMNELKLIEIPEHLEKNAKKYNKQGRETEMFCNIKVNF